MSPEGRRRGAMKTPEKVPQAERTAAGTVLTFAGYRILIFLVQLLNKPCHCLAVLMVSDKKPTRNFTKVPLSSCFQDSLHVFGF